MSITTYAELQTAIGNWLNRTDTTVTDRIPEFVANFEAFFCRKCRLRPMMERDQNTTFSAEYTALPTGFLQMVDVKLLGSTVYSLKPRSHEWLDENFIDGTSGIPRFFAISETEIRVEPPPDATYTAEMIYYKFSALSDSNTTNWLLASHPDLYLKGSLVEAEPFLFSDDRTVGWKALRDEIIQELQVAERRAAWSGGVLQAKPDRVA